jgi:hypothetical protein
LAPHDKAFASAPPGPTSTETLDSRVRRVAHILAACGRDVQTGSEDESQAVAALKHFSTSLLLVQQLTTEIRTRIGVGDWDASDALTARLLLDALTSALRSCRVVSRAATSSLVEVERAVSKGHRRSRK